MKVSFRLCATAMGMFALVCGLVAGERELRGAAIMGNIAKPGMIEVKKPTSP